MATQLSRRRRSPSNKLSELLWEPDDAYTLTTEDISRGWFEHQLIHPRINYKLLVRCKVNAGEYAHTDMIVDETTGIVHVTLGGWETVDEYVRFQYYYRHGGRLVPAPDPVPTPFEIPVSMVVGGSTPSAPDNWPLDLVADGTNRRYVGFFGDYTDPEITGFKLVGEFSGVGNIWWDIWFEEPDNPPYWPEPDHSGFSHFIGLNNNSFMWSVNGSHQTFEYEFATSSTGSDPAYGGFNYADPLGDVLATLRALNGGGSYYAANGHVDIDYNPGDSVTVHNFGLVLYGEHAP